jgi:hypothetical protein
MTPKSIVARRGAARMMASKASISKSIATRNTAANEAVNEKLPPREILNKGYNSSFMDNDTEMILASNRFREFEKIINETFNPKSMKSSSVVNVEPNDPDNEEDDSSDNASLVNETEISPLPPLNDECTVENAMYPFKLILTPQEERPLETSNQRSKYTLTAVEVWVSECHPRDIALIFKYLILFRSSQVCPHILGSRGYLGERRHSTSPSLPSISRIAR